MYPTKSGHSHVHVPDVYKTTMEFKGNLNWYYHTLLYCTNTCDSSNDYHYYPVCAWGQRGRVIRLSVGLSVSQSVSKTFSILQELGR